MPKLSSISPPLSETCLVCGEKGAAKHYGSYCCSGCKGFFRRTARFQRVYICPFENSCNITKEFRNACRSCRYTKCLSIGLNPLLVHSDRGIIGSNRSRKDSPPNLPEFPNSPNNNSISEESFTPTTSSLPETKLQLRNKLIKNREAKKGILTWKMPFHIKNDDISLPLGQLNLISNTPPKAVENVWNYFTTVERIIDNYNDDSDYLTHIAPDFNITLDISALQASETPKLICKRTKMDWTAKEFINSEIFRNIWARTVLSYFDWVSFIPELKSLDSDDRVSTTFTS
jgi:hypothetical protein